MIFSNSSAITDIMSNPLA